MRNDTSMAHLASFVKIPKSMELITSTSWAICFQKSLMPMCTGLAEGNGTPKSYVPAGQCGGAVSKVDKSYKRSGFPLDITRRGENHCYGHNVRDAALHKHIYTKGYIIG